MSINKNFKYKIYWKQIILITSLIISISVTMLYAATTNKNIILEYDADATLSGHSSQIILTSKNGKQLILQKLNQGNSVISNTDETNGRICFKTSGSVDNYICFVNNENNISMLEWQGVQGENGLFATQPAIRIHPSTGKIQYRDKGEEQWNSFGDIANVAVSESLANKDQTLSENRTVLMNKKSLTFKGTDNSIIIDSNGDIIANGQTTLNDVELNGFFKIVNNDADQYVTIQPPIDINENYALTFPKNIGNSGQVLVTDGNSKTFWQSIEIDTSISDTNQTLNGLRTIDMNGNNLIFHGEKDVIINANGDFDIKGSAALEGNLQVTDAVVFQNNLDVDDNVANVTINSSTTLGKDSSDKVNINGSLRIADNSAGNYIIIKTLESSDTEAFIFPKDNGQPSQVLKNNGKGVTSWVYDTIDTNLGNDDQTLNESRTINMSDNSLAFHGLEDVIIDASANINIGGSAKIGGTFEVTGTALLEDELEVDGPSLLNNLLNVSGNTIIGGTLEIRDTANFDNTLNVKGNITINGSTMLGDNNDITTINGPLKIVDDTNRFVIIESPDTSTNYTFSLPPNNGELGQVLLSKGTGETSWEFARTDTNIGNADQTLQESRTINMNGKILTFDGAKDVIIDGNGNIDIGGATNINNILDVSGPGILQKNLNVGGDITIGGNTILGNTNNSIAKVNGEIRLVNNSNNFAGINLPSSVSNYTIILPKDTGSKDHVLSINNNRKLSWESSKAADTNLGSSDQNLNGFRKVIMNGNNLTFDGAADITISGNGNIMDIDGNAIIDNQLEVAGQTSLNDQLTVNEATLLDTTLNVGGDAILEGTLKVTGPAVLNGTLNVNDDVTIDGNTTIANDTALIGSLRLVNDNNKYIAIKPQYPIQNYTLTLPPDKGEPSQVLVSDGTGETFWAVTQTDTNLGGSNQILEKLRTIKMNGKRLIFDGTKDIIIYDNGNIDIGGSGTLENFLTVGETTLLNDELEVGEITLLNNDLNVSGDTLIEGDLQVTDVTKFKDNLDVGGNLTINGETTLGNNIGDIITVKGSLNLSNAAGNYITIKSPTSISQDYTITLPSTGGDPNQALSINGSGEMYWLSFVDDSNLGNKDQILKDARIVSMNGNNLIFEGATENIIISNNGDFNISGDANIRGTLNILGVTNLQDLTVDGETIFNENLDVTGNTTMGGTLQVKGISTLGSTLNINNNVTINGLTTLGDNNDTTIINGTLKLADNNTRYITIQSPDIISENYIFVLPEDSGQSGQFLVTDGTGVTRWESPQSDTSLAIADQTLENDRKVIMNGKHLTFKGETKNIVISSSGDIDISGDADLKGSFEVTGTTDLKDTLTVAQEFLLRDKLDVLGDTTIKGNLQVIGPATLNSTLNVTKGLTAIGSTVLGNNNDTTIINGSLKINNSSGHIIIESPSSIPASYTLVLPPDGGNPDEILAVNGNGVTNWTSKGKDTSLASDHQTLENDRKVIMNGNNLTFEGTQDIVIYNNGGINIGGNGTIKGDFEVTKAAVLNDTLKVNQITSLNTNLEVGDNSTLLGGFEVTGAASLDSTLNVNNNVVIDGSTNLGNDNNDITTINGFLEFADNDASDYITIKAPDSLVNSYTLVLPKDKDSAGQALMTDGSGITKWESSQNDTSLANDDQTLEKDRKVIMSGNNLRFEGTKNIIISNDGAFDIGGNTDIKGSLEVTGTTDFQDTLTVKGATVLNNNLNVTKDTSIGGTLKVTESINIDNTLDVNNNVTIDGSTILGSDNNDEVKIKGFLNIINNADNSITIKSPDSLVNNYTFVLPKGPGDLGEKLVTDGEGITSWASKGNDTNLGHDNQTLLQDRTVNMNGNNLIFKGTTKDIIIYDNGNINIGGSGIIQGDFQVTGMVTLADTLTVSGTTTLNNNLHVSGETNLKGSLQVAGAATLDNTLFVTENVTIDGSTTLGNENTDATRIKGSLKIADDSGNNYITIKSLDSIADNYTFVLPPNDGEPDQLLSTDGNGITSWISAATDTSLGSDNQILLEDRYVDMSGNYLAFQGTKDVVITKNAGLNIGGNGVFKGTFQATGTTNFKNDLTVLKTTSLNNKLDVLGNSFLEGDLNVTEAATIENNLNVLEDLTIKGSTILGNDTSDEVIIKGSLNLVSNTDNYITIKPSDSIIDSYTLVLPATSGGANRLLTINGNGVISWGLPAIDTNLGSDEQTLDEDRLVTMNGNNLIFEGTTKNIIYNNSNIDIDGNGIIKGNFEVQGTTTLDDQLTVKKLTLLNNILNVTGNTDIQGTLKVAGAATLDSTLLVTENVTIDGSTTLGNENTDATKIEGLVNIFNNAGNYITIGTPVFITPYTLVLPENGGEDTYVLINNGNGITSWEAPMDDINLGNTDQKLTGARTLNLDVNNLTFDGTKDIVIYNNGDINIGGNSVVKGTLEVTGAVTLNDELIVDNSVVFNDSLDVKNNSTIGGNFKVTDAATLNIVNANNNVTINGSTTLGGSAGSNITSINGVLKLADNTASNYITIKSPDSITNNNIFILPDNAGEPNQNLYIKDTGESFWSAFDDISLGNTDIILDADRKVNMQGNTLTFQGINDVVFNPNGDIDIQGKTIGGTLEVKDDAIFPNKDFTVGGTVTIGTKLDIVNDTIIEGTFETDAHVKIGNTLEVTGNAIIQNTLNGSLPDDVFNKSILGNEPTIDTTTLNGLLRLADNDNNYVTIKKSSASTYPSFVLPETPGLPEQILTSKGNGETFWITLPDDHLGKSDQILEAERTIDMNEHTLTFKGAKDIVINDTGDIEIGGNVTIGGDIEVTGEGLVKGKLTVQGPALFQKSVKVGNNVLIENEFTSNQSFSIFNSLEIGETLNLHQGGSLVLSSEDLTKSVTLRVPSDIEESITFTLPSDEPTFSQGQNSIPLLFSEKKDGVSAMDWGASVDGSYIVPIGITHDNRYHPDNCASIDADQDQETITRFVEMYKLGGVPYGFCIEIKINSVFDAPHYPRNWYTASRICLRKDMRLPDYHEWRKFCDGKQSGPAGVTSPDFEFSSYDTSGEGEWVSSRVFAFSGPTAGERGVAGLVAGVNACDQIYWGIVRSTTNPSFTYDAGYRCVK